MLRLSKRFFWASLVFVSACASVLQTSSNVDALASAERLLENFERVVFHAEYDDGRRPDRVRKWGGPLRIALFGDEAPRYRAAVARYAVTLSALTGLAIEVLPEPGVGHNVEVHFVPWDDMEALARPHSANPEWLGTIIEASSCLFLFKRAADFQIRWAMVLVSTDERIEENEACLLEELTQILGMPNDSELIRPSIFNQWDRLTRLPLNDQILVRTLYDERMQPNMPRELALRTADSVIRELVRKARDAP